MPGLDKSQRLLTKRDFDLTLNGSGFKIVCRDFVLVVTTKPVDGPARLGLIVSGKVGNSVIRNKVKRSVREVFRNELASHPKLAGRNLVVIARPTLVNKECQIAGDAQDMFRHCANKLIAKL